MGLSDYREVVFQPMFDTIVDDILPERVRFFVDSNNLGTWKTNQTQAGVLPRDNTAKIYSASLLLMQSELDQKLVSLLANASVEMQLGVKLYGGQPLTQLTREAEGPEQAPPVQAVFRMDFSSAPIGNYNYVTKQKEAFTGTEAVLEKEWRTGPFSKGLRKDLVPIAKEAEDLLDKLLRNEYGRAVLKHGGWRESPIPLELPCRQGFCAHLTLPDGFREAWNASKPGKALRLVIDAVIVRDVQ